MPLEPGGFHLADKLSMYERCASSTPSAPHTPYTPRQGSAPPFRARAIRDPEPGQTQAMVTEWVEPEIHLVGGYSFPSKPVHPDRGASYKQQMYEASAMALSNKLRRGKKPRGKPVVSWTIEEIMPRLTCIPMKNGPAGNAPAAGAADELRPQTAPAPRPKRPPPPATDVVAFMTPAEYRKSLVTPARAASPADSAPADAPTDAARETLVAIGQTPGALVSLKGRRSPPPPATSSSSQRQRGTQSALLPLPGAPLPGTEPRPTSSRRPPGGVQERAQPAAEAAAPASDEGAVLAAPSPRQQQYEAATADPNPEPD